VSSSAKSLASAGTNARNVSASRATTVQRDDTMAVVDSEVAWEAVTGPDATDRFADGTIVLQWCAMSPSQLLADVHGVSSHSTTWSSKSSAPSSASGWWRS